MANPFVGALNAQLQADDAVTRAVRACANLAAVKAVARPEPLSFGLPPPPAPWCLPGDELAAAYAAAANVYSAAGYTTPAMPTAGTFPHVGPTAAMAGVMPEAAVPRAAPLPAEQPLPPPPLAHVYPPPAYALPAAQLPPQPMHPATATAISDVYRHTEIGAAAANLAHANAAAAKTLVGVGRLH
eukprot:TRINITY_DN16998_c0_g1_i1.p1 TRINITY_DN16998_c0_g1~~TRINITY_DN16998_c0_g1_i1.p1  ORF type:complete len:207 (+),score=13.34 TRINITY_DN16998_c0_g1_i1:69-623(+)